MIMKLVSSSSLSSSDGGVAAFRRGLGALVVSSCTLFFLSMTSIHGVTAQKNNNINNNMIPGDYLIANPMGPTVYETQYKSEYFDVYSPTLKSRYSEVIWKSYDNIPLPPEIVKRFTNKTMAIIGYEVDQVKIDPLTGDEIPVPITHAYNHHYMASVKNKNKYQSVKRKITLEEFQTNPHLYGAMGHGSEEVMVLQLNQESANENFTVETQPHQVFSEANGGEMRLSWHGYPKGYAQLVYSPNVYAITPMQVDTWNRDHVGPEFVPGPLPKASPQRGNPKAIYSGLLECPCSDRLQKEWKIKYAILQGNAFQQQCNNANNSKGRIQNATECFDAADVVVPIRKSVEHHVVDTKNNDHHKTSPQGCSINQKEDGVLQVYWKEPAKEHEEQEEDLQKKTTSSSVMAFASGAVNATVELETVEGGQATITIVGPADKWFGIGFGTLTMCRHMEADECQGGGPYTILVFDDRIEERHLGEHAPGTVLPKKTLTVVSNTINDSGLNRTVVLKRPLQVDDDDEDYFSFDFKKPTLDVILARGCDMPFAQHCGHGSATMNFMAVDTPLRICRNGIDGKIGGRAFSDHRCLPFPKSTLLESHNPTCDIRTYSGGLSCCRHGKSLLDSNQEIPWADQVLEYRLKFRYHFEEYKPAVASTKPSHQHLVRLYWQTEAHAGEYDITACPAGTPPSQCIQVITSRWKVSQMISDHPWHSGWGTGPGSSKADGIQLIYAGPHCHAPTCLSMELYNADTGNLLCRVEPIHGGSPSKVYDELGYLAIPPCLWSDNPNDGLMSPTFLSLNTTLLSIKRNNNTVSHWGEMASWQMRGVVINPRPEVVDENKKKAKEEVQEEVVAEPASNQETGKKTSVLRGATPQIYLVGPAARPEV